MYEIVDLWNQTSGKIKVVSKNWNQADV